MGELRDRMVREMQLRGFRPRTQEAYLHVVTEMVKHFRRAPGELTGEEIKGFVQHLIVERKLGNATVNVWVSAIKFLYDETMGRPEVCARLPRRRNAKRLPVVLSAGEVERLLVAAGRVQQRTLLMAAYSAGLRSNELVHLRVEDLDRERMMVRVREAKGGKERYTILSPRFLKQLEAYRADSGVRSGWLFPGEKPGAHLTREAATKAYNRAKARAGIYKAGGIHVLRHSFATHMLEAGVDVRTIQLLMGHGSIRTTIRYLHLTDQRVCGAGSPLDGLKLEDPGLGYLR